MLNPNPEMLLRIAQADAYTAAIEYYKYPEDADDVIQSLKFEKYLKPKYTDDGQMSIAVAEVLLDGPPYTELKFADAFVRCFKRDKRVGYAGGFYKFLCGIKTGKEFLEKINPTSEKNGAAMRSVPIGVLSTPEEVLEVASLQAKLTHNTPAGIFSAQCVALMSHFALYHSEGFDKIIPYCAKYLPEFEYFEQPWSGTVCPPNVGLKTVYAVVHCLRTQTTLIDVLREIILIGGDTDTVAAIAWGIASTRMRETLPEFFETDLEPNRRYGVPFLRELGTQLMISAA